MTEKLLNLNKERLIRQAKRSLIPLSAAGALALSGCSPLDKEEKNQYRPPELKSVASGKGEKTVTLRISGAPNNKRPKKLRIGTSIDCDAPSGTYKTRIQIEETLTDVSNGVCEDPQYFDIPVPPSNELYRANKVGLQVSTTDPKVEWSVGSEIINK